MEIIFGYQYRLTGASGMGRAAGMAAERALATYNNRADAVVVFNAASAIHRTVVN
jgi:hypothetical protein